MKRNIPINEGTKIVMICDSDYIFEIRRRYFTLYCIRSKPKKIKLNPYIDHSTQSAYGCIEVDSITGGFLNIQFAFYDFLLWERGLTSIKEHEETMICIDKRGIDGIIKETDYPLRH